MRHSSFWLATAGLWLGLSGAALAQPMQVFGDSLTDGGNNFTRRNTGLPKPPYDQRSSNGPVWVEQMAGLIGAEPVTPSLRGGGNYAYGGAQSGTNSLHPADGTDGSDQLAQFLARHEKADPKALYVVWLGANDLGQIARERGISPERAQAVVEEAAGNVAGIVRSLAAIGARRFLLVTVPDRGLVPRYSKAGAEVAADATAKSAALNAAILPRVTDVAREAGLELRVFDAFATYRAVVADPARYGMTNAADVCWNGDFTGQNGTQCATPDTYFFWDPAHPTTAGHRILAEAAAAVMKAPPLIAAR